MTPSLLARGARRKIEVNGRHALDAAPRHPMPSVAEAGFTVVYDLLESRETPGEGGSTLPRPELTYSWPTYRER